MIVSSRVDPPAVYKQELCVHGQGLLDLGSSFDRNAPTLMVVVNLGYQWVGFVPLNSSFIAMSCVDTS